MEAELKANAHQKDYLPVEGLRNLREAVAEYHRRSQGVELSAEDVLIGPGSKELMFILQLVYYGDLVIPTPSWVSYAPRPTSSASRSAGCRPATRTTGACCPRSWRSSVRRIPPGPAS